MKPFGKTIKISRDDLISPWDDLISPWTDKKFVGLVMAGRELEPKDAESLAYMEKVKNLLDNRLLRVYAIISKEAEDKLKYVAQNGLQPLTTFSGCPNPEKVREDEKKIIDQLHHHLSEEGRQEAAKTLYNTNPVWYDDYTEDMHKIAKLLAFYVLNFKEKNDPFYNLALQIHYDKYFKLSKKQWRKFVVNNQESKTIINLLKGSRPFKRGQIVRLDFQNSRNMMIKLNDDWFLLDGFQHLSTQPTISSEKFWNILEQLKKRLSGNATILCPLSIIIVPFKSTRYYYVKIDGISEPIAIEERSLHTIR